MLDRSDFLVELVRRRLVERYVGSTSTALWAFASPLTPLLINMIIFYFVARVPEVRTMGVPAYAAFAFTGLIAFRLLQRAIAEGCELLVNNLDMLRSVNFPLPYLSLASVGTLLADLAIQFMLLVALLLWSGTPVGSNLLGLPVAIAILLLLAVGASWIVSIAGYVARETQEILNVGMTLLLYLSPAVYPVDAAPESLRYLIQINPLTHVVVMFRDTLVQDGAGIHWRSWAVSATLAGSVFLLGWVAIVRLRRLVGDLV